ncbi:MULTISPECIES: restriction endonuclease subunit S [Gammaproteobacteria]|uniref:restriction endonuclease subunit S n=1 Tax=Gammaproteobacteria TaxID=1236 RepID=UPI0031F541C5
MSVENNVPEIRFKGFSGEWMEHNLGELIDIRSAARVHKEQWTETGVPFFRTSDVVSIYKGQENAKAFISYDVYKELTGKIGKVSSGDLLVTGGGSIGIPFLVPNDEPLYFKDADLLWFKNDQKCDGYYLYTFLFSKAFKKYIKSISHIGTIAHYTIEQAKATPIKKCERAEQTAIGNTFQKLDNLIKQHQQKHDKLSNIKKAMLEKMFPKQGKTIPEIRFKGFSEEWKTSTLGCLVSFYKGKGLPKSSIQYDGIYSCVHYGELFTKYSEVIDLVTSRTNQSDSFFSMSNDVLMPTSDVTPKGLVKPCCVKQSGVVLGGDILVIRPNNQNIIDGSFLSRFIRAREQQVLQNVTGSTVFHLYASSIEGLGIVFPSIDEQTAISSYFQKLDALINQHQQQITKLNNIKQACLSKMFV